MQDLIEFGHRPSTIRLGDLEVCRLGFGAMQLPGPHVWGEPENPEKAKTVLKKVIDLGINLIDTSWYYGPLVSNRLIKEALYPYPEDLVIACKLGGKRLPDKSWVPFIRPEEIRQGCEEDLRSLKLDRIDVVHLRLIGNDVPFLESLDAMIDLQKEGKIKHIGLSNIDLIHLELAMERTPIVSVQNLYNVSNKSPYMPMNQAMIDGTEAVLNKCTQLGIAFMPFFPFGSGKVLNEKSPISKVANTLGITIAQAGVAWLLAKSPVILPIPGTSSIAHLIENWEARKIILDETAFNMATALV